MWFPRDIFCHTARHLHTVNLQAMLQITCLISMNAPILAEQGSLKHWPPQPDYTPRCSNKSLRNARKNEPAQEWSPSVPAFAQTTGEGQGNILVRVHYFWSCVKICLNAEVCYPVWAASVFSSSCSTNIGASIDIKQVS